MKAVQINRYGDSSVVAINEIAKPETKPGYVLIQVYSASLNPFDSTLISGKLKNKLPIDLPFTLGGDMAGEVVAIGSDVDGISVGDKVYGQASVAGGNSGAIAEYSLTKSSQVAIMPSNVSFNQACTLPLVVSSAWQGLVDHIHIKIGQKIFIHGGSGGIGSAAISIAKNLSCYVATTATGGGIDYVRKLGADEAVDYKSQKFENILNEYDGVFDTTNGSEFDKCLRILKPGGIAVSMVGKANDDEANKLKVIAINQSTKVTTEKLNQITKLVESGVIKPKIGKVFSIDKAQEAFEARESGKVLGKIVIEIKKS